MDRRLLKVLLPANLVEAMDETIAEVGYPDRAAFLSDAVANLVADLSEEVPTSQPGGSLGGVVPEPQGPDRRTLTASDRIGLVPGGPESEQLGAALMAPAEGTPLAPGMGPPAIQPTWGMHNRDWPTLWAASELGRATFGGAVHYKPWVKKLVDRAWTLAEQMRGEDFDSSGLPSNREKFERSAGRYQSFFVGDAPGIGPLFSLQLAAADGPESVLLTKPGAHLLRSLAGLEPRRHGSVRPEWRLAFLTHLAAWVPADFEFLCQVVEHIAAGRTSRVELLQAVDDDHPEWTKESFVATNVAGFVARGREWNVIDPRQTNRRYELVPDGLQALAEARAAAETLRSRFE